MYYHNIFNYDMHVVKMNAIILNNNNKNDDDENEYYGLKNKSEFI